MPRVMRLEVMAVDLPFHRRFRHAAAARNSSESLFVKCVTDAATVGFGESLPREYVTDETRDDAFVRLETMSVDEITRIWDALEGSYQLSVSYEVSLVNIDAALEPESIMPVLVAQPEFGLANLVSAGS